MDEDIAPTASPVFLQLLLQEERISPSLPLALPPWNLEDDDSDVNKHLDLSLPASSAPPPSTTYNVPGLNSSAVKEEGEGESVYLSTFLLQWGSNT